MHRPLRLIGLGLALLRLLGGRGSPRARRAGHTLLVEETLSLVLETLICVGMLLLDELSRAQRKTLLLLSCLLAQATHTLLIRLTLLGKEIIEGVIAVVHDGVPSMRGGAGAHPAEGDFGVPSPRGGEGFRSPPAFRATPHPSGSGPHGRGDPPW